MGQWIMGYIQHDYNNAKIIKKKYILEGLIGDRITPAHRRAYCLYGTNVDQIPRCIFFQITLLYKDLHSKTSRSIYEKCVLSDYRTYRTQLPLAK